MGNNIFLIQSDGTLHPMSEQPYSTEDLLQKLLEDYPELLGGDQFGSDVPRRLILVSREFGIPGEPNGYERWSVDHLFIDQAGIPTLVEVKRSTDTRIRREVVGQMLDYAANAVVYWPVEIIRAKFSATCDKNKADPVSLVQVLLNLAADDINGVEAFWDRVKTNLQAGRIRLIFLADKIPAELQRIVEFLNTQMDPAEVIAIELREFVGKDVKTLVPRVFGLTAGATGRKGTGRREIRQWDEETFFKELAEQSGLESVAIAREILNWIKPKTSRIWWGQGRELGSFVPVLDHGENEFFFFAVWTNGTVEIHFQYLQRRSPFDREETRLELLRRLDLINGFNLTNDLVTRRPTRLLILLKDPGAMKTFQEAIDWALAQVQESGYAQKRTS